MKSKYVMCVAGGGHRVPPQCRAQYRNEQLKFVCLGMSHYACYKRQ